MTIWIDNRVGSAEFQPKLATLGMDAQLMLLPYGDFQFTGNGPHGQVAVIVERKTFLDLISSIKTGRILDQLYGMLTYGDTEDNLPSDPYLLIEGTVSPAISVKCGMPMNRIYNALIAYQEVGIKLIHTTNPNETTHYLYNMLNRFQRPWESHTSTNALMKSQDILVARDNHLVASTAICTKRRIGLVERVALQVPRIGPKNCVKARFFNNVRDMATANYHAWVSAGFTEKTAKMIVRTLQVGDLE